MPIGNLREIKPENDDVIITHKAWFNHIDPDLTEAIVAVREIHSIFHRLDVARWTGAVIDDEALQAVETAVKDLFEL